MHITEVNVNISTDYLVFDVVRLGHYDQRVLFIRNTCGLATTYQLITNITSGKSESSSKESKDRVFTATVFPIMDGQSSGCISSGDEIRIVIGFVPPRAGHYYRRLTLLVSNQVNTFLDTIVYLHFG